MKPGAGLLVTDVGAWTDGRVEPRAEPAGRSVGLGRIAPGRPVDLVVREADLHRLPTCMLHEARPTCTLLAGEAVHPGAPARQQAVPSLRQDP